jgi:hypothetical protein
MSTTIMGSKLAELRRRPFSGLDFSAEALSAAELAELQQLTAQRELCRQGNVEAIVIGIGHVDQWASYQQLRDITHALAELAERMHSRVQSVEMANVCDGISDALGWAQSLIQGDDTPINYGGTDD